MANPALHEVMMVNKHGHSRIRKLATGLFAISAIAAAAWLYAEEQIDQQKLGAEITQLKLSLQLYGRQYTATATSMTDVNTTLEALEERLASLEKTLARDGVAAPAASESAVDAAVLPVPAPKPHAQTSGTRTDCVSQNSPFLVAAGDIFPVCGTSGWVAVTEVGEQRISFANGNAAYVGRSIPLDGTPCTLTVRSANAAWLAGYGEVQVSC
jgi:hypothetical protein